MYVIEAIINFIISSKTSRTSEVIDTLCNQVAISNSKF